MTAPQRPTWPALDALLRRIDAVLAEPADPWLAARYWYGAQWRVAAAAHRPPDALQFVRAAANSPLDAGGYVIATPAAIVTVPPTDTRPKWIGRLRRRLFGEPPQ